MTAPDDGRGGEGWAAELAEIARRRDAAKAQGGPAAVAKHHGRGRLTIRERIDTLLDPGSFQEQGPIAGSDEDGTFTPGNYVLGFGKVDGRPVIVGGEDFTMGAGTPNVAGLRKSIYTEELAVQYKVPLIRLHEGSGASITGSGGRNRPPPLPDPVFAAHRFTSVGRTLAQVPVATAAVGTVAGLPASRLVSAHYTVMTRSTAAIMAGGPALVERALGRPVTREELGGPEVHERSGVVDDVVEDEREAFVAIRRFLSYLPRNVWERPPVVRSGDPVERMDDDLRHAVPRNRRQVYDMRRILKAVVDRDSLFEMTRKFGPSLITALARLDGVPVAVIANDCRHMGGALTAPAARKMRRFIEFAEVFHLPILSFVDEPGFMIGPEAEREGTIRFGSSAVIAAALCSVPWASIIVRKSMGLASAAHYGAGALVLAWPSAQSGALPVEGGVAVAFAKEIAAAPDPAARRAELEEALAARTSPFPRSESFSVHDLIDPAETRPRLAQWLDLAAPLLDRHLGITHFTYRP
ncbi:acyl-CoA carboxylase subunit beta [Zavarzinia sp. CC-PAN008]|uniref:acyl-CoA carboxylase subunit beta n=1 Tax=Zavarzinia sp. CC-PAN008 TaxID=3243332 RepID=UPI003F74A058